MKCTLATKKTLAHIWTKYSAIHLQFSTLSIIHKPISSCIYFNLPHVSASPQWILLIEVSKVPEMISRAGYVSSADDADSATAFMLLAQLIFRVPVMPVMLMVLTMPTVPAVPLLSCYLHNSCSECRWCRLCRWSRLCRQCRQCHYCQVTCSSHVQSADGAGSADKFHGADSAEGAEHVSCVSTVLTNRQVGSMSDSPAYWSWWVSCMSAPDFNHLSKGRNEWEMLQISLEFRAQWHWGPLGATVEYSTLDGHF